jgi:H/ACA ribonucleoprotein complex non-core subunit NAF1
MADLAAALAAATADVEVMRGPVEPTETTVAATKSSAEARDVEAMGESRDVDDSDSSSSSSEDSSSDSDSDGDTEELRKKILDKLDEGEDGEDEGAIPSFPKTKNEVLPDEVTGAPVPKIIVEDGMAIEKVGFVMNVMDGKNALVQTEVDSVAPMDQGSVLCVLREKDRSRITLGVVDDIFGPIGRPLYVVRMPDDADEILELLRENAEVEVFSVSEMVKAIDPNKLDRRGSDASNRYDEEVEDDERDFSDDEAEAQAKRNRKRSQANSKPRRRVQIPNSEGPRPRQRATGTAYHNQTPLQPFGQPPFPPQQQHHYPQQYPPPMLMPMMYAPPQGNHGMYPQQHAMMGMPYAMPPGRGYPIAPLMPQMHYAPTHQQQPPWPRGGHPAPPRPNMPLPSYFRPPPNASPKHDKTQQQ